MGVPIEGSGRLDLTAGRSAFGEDAAAYHKARSGYPPELFERLAIQAAPSPRVLEIGAGTGLASEGLLGLSPSELTIVESDPRLCAFLERRFARLDVRVVRAPFPDVDIDGRYDLIACAAAFHWMEPVSALAKIKSLLAPGGTWAMWWNCYFGHGEVDAFGARVAQILADEEVALPPSYQGSNHYALNAEHHTRSLQQAGFFKIEHVVMRTPRALSAQQARELYQSFSFIRALPEAARSRVLDRIAGTVDREFAGTAQSIVATSLYASTA